MGVGMLNGAIYFPEPVYKSLPWIYVAGGAVVMYTLGNFIGFLSGLLMTSAGMLVFLWRAAARASRTGSGATRRGPVRTGRLDID